VPFVKFVETRRVEDSTGRVFEEGKVYDLPEESCTHWVARGAAVRLGASDTKSLEAKDMPEDVRKAAEGVQTKSQRKEAERKALVAERKANEKAAAEAEKEEADLPAGPGEAAVAAREAEEVAKAERAAANSGRSVVQAPGGAKTAGEQPKADQPKPVEHKK
jgi:hypothetical protein